MSKFDLASIDFDNIEDHDVKHLPSSFDGDNLFVLSQMHTGDSWMAWTRCAMDILGATLRPQITKLILKCLSDTQLVQVIFNALMITMIICIAMQVYATTLHGQGQHLSHFIWVVLHL